MWCGGGIPLPERFAAVLPGWPGQPANACQNGKTEKPVVLNAFPQALKQREFRIDHSQGVFGDLRRAEASAHALKTGQECPAAGLHMGHRIAEAARHGPAPPDGCRSNHPKKMLSVRHEKALLAARKNTTTRTSSPPPAVSAATPGPPTWGVRN